MILVKTESGQQAFKERSVPLSPRQRSAFILFDGKRSLDDVLAAGMGVQREDIDQMVSLGLLASAGGAVAAGVSEPVKVVAAAAATAAAASGSVAGSSGRSAQQRYKDAYPIATLLTGSLGLMGFRLNMQVEACGNYDDLLQLLPKIKAAVGPEKALLLERALNE